jgi:hypothetical protein
MRVEFWALSGENSAPVQQAFPTNTWGRRSNQLGDRSAPFTRASSLQVMEDSLETASIIVIVINFQQR